MDPGSVISLIGAGTSLAIVTASLVLTAAGPRRLWVGTSMLLLQGLGSLHADEMSSNPPRGSRCMAKWNQDADRAASEILRNLGEELGQAARQRARLAASEWVSADHVRLAAMMLFAGANGVWLAQLITAISLLILGGATGFWVTYFFSPSDVQEQVKTYVHVVVTCVSIIAAGAFGVAQRSLRRY
jgi:hypothetical protein